MSEPTLNQHLAAVSESLQVAIGENECVFDFEIIPTPSTEGLPLMRVVSVDKRTNAEKPTMAKIRCRRFMDGDTKMIEILKMSGIYPTIQLPKEYIHHMPRFQWIEDNNNEHIRIVVTHYKVYNIHIGDKITYKKYGELMRIMKEAGQRLTDINARRKKEKEFSGEFEVTI